MSVLTDQQTITHLREQLVSLINDKKGLYDETVKLKKVIIKLTVDALVEDK